MADSVLKEIPTLNVVGNNKRFVASNCRTEVKFGNASSRTRTMHTSRDESKEVRPLKRINDPKEPSAE